VVPPNRRTVRSPTSMSATVAGTTFRPAPSYTTLWDVTPEGARCLCQASSDMASRPSSVVGHEHARTVLPPRPCVSGEDCRPRNHASSPGTAESPRWRRSGKSRSMSSASPQPVRVTVSRPVERLRPPASRRRRMACGCPGCRATTLDAWRRVGLANKAWRLTARITG
jgi:hypothetical protein